MSLTTAFQTTYYKNPGITLDQAWNHLMELFQDKATDGDLALRIPGYKKIELINTPQPVEGAKIETTQVNGMPVSGTIRHSGVSIRQKEIQGKGQPVDMEQKQLILKFSSASYGGYHVGYENNKFTISYDLGFSAPKENNPTQRVSIWTMIEVKGAGFWDSKPAKNGDKDNGVLVGPRFTANHAMREIEGMFFTQLVDRAT